jgi:hypothetical protein
MTQHAAVISRQSAAIFILIADDKHNVSECKSAALKLQQNGKAVQFQKHDARGKPSQICQIKKQARQLCLNILVWV